jgi:5-hydroxyisourate hydrolase
MQHSIKPRRGFLAAGLSLGGAVLAPRPVAAADPPAPPTGLKAAPTSQAGLSPRLTFHAIDIFHGGTGAGLKVDLARFDNGSWRVLKTVDVVPGGRPAEPLLVGDAYQAGRYEVTMHVAEYFEKLGVRLPARPFLSNVPLRIVVHDASQRVHLPVLFTPWSYSFYRGS